MASDSRKLLLDFSAPAAAELATQQGLEATCSDDGLAICLSPDNGEALSLAIPDAIPLADWTSFDTLALEVSNPEEREVIIVVTLRGERGSTQRGEFSWFSAKASPSTRTTWRIPLQHLRYTEVWGWPWGWPSQEGLRDFSSVGRVNTHALAEVVISLKRADGSDSPRRTITLHRIALENPIASRGWIDEYGQRSNMDWPEKVRKDGDLRAADQREGAELAEAEPFPERDEFQAWTDGPAREATGFFRVEEIAGRWWFIAPNGHVFYAVGIDVVGAGADAPQHHLVPEAYSWRPEKEGEFAQAWSSGLWGGGRREGEYLSLYRANLIRKWGPRELSEKAGARAQDRQLAWGFTCLGNWTDVSILRKPRLPYFTTGPDMKRVTIPEISRHIMDVYDPRFEAQARAAAAPLAELKDDPMVVGHFVF